MKFYSYLFFALLSLSQMSPAGASDGLTLYEAFPQLKRPSQVGFSWGSCLRLLLPKKSERASDSALVRLVPSGINVETLDYRTLREAMKRVDGKMDEAVALYYSLYMDGGNSLYTNLHRLFTKWVKDASGNGMEIVPPDSIDRNDPQQVLNWQNKLPDLMILNGPIVHFVLALMDDPQADPESIELAMNLANEKIGFRPRSTDKVSFWTVPNGGGEIDPLSLEEYIRVEHRFQRSGEFSALSNLREKVSIFGDLLFGKLHGDTALIGSNLKSGTLKNGNLRLLASHPLFQSYVYHRLVVLLAINNGELGAMESTTRSSMTNHIQAKILRLMVDYFPNEKPDQLNQFLNDSIDSVLLSEKFVENLSYIVNLNEGDLQYLKSLSPENLPAPYQMAFRSHPSVD